MRHEHWLTSLESLLQSRQNSPFIWGKQDCCLFAADAVEAMTGVDIASEYRGKYADEASAFALLASVTGVENATVEDAMRRAESFEFINPLPSPLFAQRGDVVSLLLNSQLILGVVGMSGQHAMITGENGLLKFPVVKCKSAWRIR